MTWTPEKQREFMRTYYLENRAKWENARKSETPEHKEARLKKSRAYHNANSGKLRARKIANAEHIKNVQYIGRNLKRYGLTAEIFDATLAAQNGGCAICQLPMSKPVVDHCHTTGCVRALLCSKCNTGIGLFGEDISNLLGAIAYLEAWAKIVEARKAAA